MYRALLVAEYIIHYCNIHGLPMNNLRLQKILYFVQAEFLVSKGVPCFSEPIEAWDFGPVVPIVYSHYKLCGGLNIPDGRLHGYIDQKDQRIIYGIIHRCACFTTPTLVDITCRQTPWMRAYAPYRRNAISILHIREFFLENEKAKK